MFTLILALTYICFISLGLPDSLLGSAWPVMQQQMNVPVSYAGIVSMIICLNTIISSLMSNFLIHKLGIGRIIAISIATTAVALFGFSVSSQYWMLLLWAIPYGLGAGCVDSVLNNYAALHFKSQHMSWLHCMWGVGASISPYIMSFALIGLDNWHHGYLIVSVIQIVLSFFITANFWAQLLANLINIFSIMVSLNIGLAVFNLLPIPPLDGSRILGIVLPERTYFEIMKYERFIRLLLIGAIWSGVLDTPISFVRNYVYQGLNFLTGFVDLFVRYVL